MEHCGNRGRGRSKWLAALGLCAGMLAVEPANAQPGGEGSRVAIGFSNLLARLEDDEIGFAKAEYRVHILEELRNAGFNAVGAENLVFNRDDSEKADLVLGGTVKELACRSVGAQLRCGVGIEWQLLDRERDEVVYRVLTRFVALNLQKDKTATAGRTLTLGALRSLIGRPRFKALATATHLALPADAAYAPAAFRSCEAAPSQLPADFDAVAEGTVMIKSGGGIGSGFFLGPDGLVMTAAHVVSAGKVEVQTRNGKSVAGRVVRIARKQDVALIALADAGSVVRPCPSIEPAPQSTGSDVYAIGSPTGEQLAFSLSRGIVSGLRTIGDVALIQTDASLSPGNSGGALLDKQGRVVGVVSRKIAGHAVEGLGFAIPIQPALDALKLVPGPSTTPSLLQRVPEPTAAPTNQAGVNDTPDPKSSLDPEGDRALLRHNDLARRLREQRERTPGYLGPMRWVGFATGLAGGFVVVLTAAAKEDFMTYSEYRDLRFKNDVGWAMLLAGSGAFVTSYILAPGLEPSKLSQTPRWSLAAGPGDVRMKVSFQ
jgi:serine protease Do